MNLKSKLAKNKLDPKLYVTEKYFQFLDLKIQNISKEILANFKEFSNMELKLLADYALATLHNNWENLNNRGYSVLHLFCWHYWYGDKEEAIDPYGYKINKSNFGTGPGNWNVDHIFPHSKGGITTIENGIPTSYDANELKSNNVSGIINGKKYNVNKIATLQGPIGTLEIDSKIFKPYDKDINNIDFNKALKF